MNIENIPTEAIETMRKRIKSRIPDDKYNSPAWRYWSVMSCVYCRLAIEENRRFAKEKGIKI